MVVLDGYGLSFYSEELVAHCKIDASKAIEVLKECHDALEQLKQANHFNP